MKKRIPSIVFPLLCVALYACTMHLSKVSILPTKAVRVSKPPAARPLAEIIQGRIGLAWSNADVAVPALLQTGLEGSTNLVDWYELARLDYTTSVLVRLTNRPANEFYRAFNDFRTSAVQAAK